MAGSSPDSAQSDDQTPPRSAPATLSTRPMLGGYPQHVLSPLAPGLPPLDKIQTDFRNPTLEGRRLFAEAFGTFLLLLADAGAPVVNAASGGKIPLSAQVVTPGLMVMAIILFMGATSGAHLNPAVTISFATRGDFPWRRVPGYIAAQFGGAILACAFLVAVFGKVGMVGATVPGPGFSDAQAFVIEIVLTVGLVSTILGTASKAQNVGTLAALAVGGYIALAGLWAAPVSGASMNPARSLGPEILLGNVSLAWIYVVAPIIGGLVAVGIAHVLRGPGGDVPAIRAAQGRLPEILAESYGAPQGSPTTSSPSKPSSPPIQGDPGR